jgi:hypothetical protein
VDPVHSRSSPRDEEYWDKLTNAGFQSVGIEPTRVYPGVYPVEDAREFLAVCDSAANEVSPV